MCFTTKLSKSLFYQKDVKNLFLSQKYLKEISNFFVENLTKRYFLYGHLSQTPLKPKSHLATSEIERQ